VVSAGRVTLRVPCACVFVRVRVRVRVCERVCARRVYGGGGGGGGYDDTVHTARSAPT